MTRKSRFLGGLGFGYLQQLVVIVAGIWLTPFFLSRLGQHDYGIWLILTQITAYLGLLDLGVVGLLPRETAFILGRDGTTSPDLPRLVGQTIRILLFQWPVVAVCAAGVWLLGRAFWWSAQAPLAIILLVFVAMFPLRIFAALLQGLQELGFLARAQTASWMIGTALAVCLLFYGRGVEALALSWAVMQLTNTIVCFFRLKRKYPALLSLGSIRHFGREAALDRIKKGTWVSVSQVAQILTTGSDMLVIGKMAGPAATVPYSCTGKLAGVLANKPQLMMQTAFPVLSELRAAAGRDRICRATVALGQAMLLVSGAVACVVLAVNRHFVGWWIGSGMYGGGLLTALIVVAMVARHWNSTFSYSLFCFGYERRLALTALADGSVSILASVILISRIGVIGAPIGMLLGTCLINMPLNLVALAREMGVSPRILIRSSENWLIRFGLACVIGTLISAAWAVPSLISSIMTATVSAILYTTFLLPVVFREPLGSYVRPSLEIFPLLTSRLSRFRLAS